MQLWKSPSSLLKICQKTRGYLKNHLEVGRETHSPGRRKTEASKPTYVADRREMKTPKEEGRLGETLSRRNLRETACSTF